MKTTNMFFAFSAVILLVSSCSLSTDTKSTNKIVPSVTEKTFPSEVLDSEKPVLIEFYADWCRPCGKLTPIYEKLAKKFKNQVKFVKIHVQTAPTLVESYKIESLPTMIFYSSKCAKAKELVGLATEEKIDNFIDNCLDECK